MNSLLTVKEAAFEIGVSEDTVRRWIGDGKIDAVYVHPTNRVRVPRDEVEAVMFPRDEEGAKSDTKR